MSQPLLLHCYLCSCWFQCPGLHRMTGLTVRKHNQRTRTRTRTKTKTAPSKTITPARMKIGVTSRGRKGRIIMLVPRTGALKTRGQRTGRGTMLVRKSKPGLRSRLVRKNGAMTIWDVNKNNGAPRSAMKAANAQPKNIADSAFPTIDFTPALDESIVFMLTASRS